MRHLAYITSVYPFPPDKINGLRTSNEAFLKALLQFSSCEQLDLFLPKNEIPAFESHWATLLNGASLKVRVQVHSLWDIPIQLSQGNFDLALLGDPILEPLAELRHALAQKPFPIVGITHSLHLYRGSFRGLSALLSRILPFDRIVCSSEAGKTVLEQTFKQQSEWLQNRLNTPLQLPFPTMEKIPLGVEIPPPTGLPLKEVRQTLDLPEHDPILLCNARICINTKMDHMPLLLALKELIQIPGLENTRLLIAGSTALENGYLSALGFRITQLGLDQHVFFKLNYENWVKPYLYEAADALLSLPDNIQETFGISPVEAMFAGKPIVLTDWDGHSELIEDGKEGFLIPTYWGEGDPLVDFTAKFSAAQSLFYASQSVALDIPILVDRLKQLLLNADLRASFGAAGKKRAQALFKWEIIIKSYETLWAKLIQESKNYPWPGPTRQMDTPSLFETFGHYPTHLFQSNTELSITPYGTRVLNKSETLSLYPSVLSWIPANVVFSLLEKTASAQTVGALSSSLGYPPNLVLFLTLWMTKNGLLKVEKI